MYSLNHGTSSWLGYPTKEVLILAVRQGPGQRALGSVFGSMRLLAANVKTRYRPFSTSDMQ